MKTGTPSDMALSYGAVIVKTLTITSLGVITPLPASITGHSSPFPRGLCQCLNVLPLKAEHPHHVLKHDGPPPSASAGRPSMRDLDSLELLNPQQKTVLREGGSH